MISKIACLYEDIICEDVVKDWFEDNSPLLSLIILEINFFLFILFERIAYKKYEIEKFVKNTIVRKKV